ncbi:MAG: NYN domain-containing protein [Deltaproteobacteria bacterium]|nr:NYN domain-containing protein [Deltaproteobacteria bacterium]
MAGRTVIVDGYNFIGSTSTLERGRLEARRESLALRADRYAAARGHRLLVVFDGADHPVRPGRSLPHSRAVEVFSRPGEKADAWIVDEVRRLRGGCVVVTNDRPLSHACEREGAVTVRCEWFDAAMRRAGSRPAAVPPSAADPSPARLPAEFPPADDDETAWRRFTEGMADGPPPDVVRAMLDVPDDVARSRGEDEDFPAGHAAIEPGLTRAERHRRNVLAEL